MGRRAATRTTAGLLAAATTFTLCTAPASALELTPPKLPNGPSWSSLPAVTAIAQKLGINRPERGGADDFYTTSTITIGAPGDIIRTKRAFFLGASATPGQPVPTSAEKIMYSSTGADGQPIAVTGYVVEPVVPWEGEGPRPTVVIGRGTVGQGDQCAASRNWPLDGRLGPLTSGRTVLLEGIFDWAFTQRGVRVVVTDYYGMGTEALHTYMNRADQAHAMLDAARAARNLVSERGEAFGDVGFYGHSQGAGASAAAVEEAGTYAPDLSVAGAYASAPPADLESVLRHIDGSNLTGALAFAINGLVSRYPQIQPELDSVLSDRGRQVLDQAKSMCTDEVRDAFGFTTTREWTKDGRSLGEILADLPESRRVIDAQRIGRGVPKAPVMIIAGRYDNNVLYDQSKALARTWCEAGAHVVYRDDYLPQIRNENHGLLAVTGSQFGVGFLIDRFKHKPVGRSCIISAD